MSTDLQNQPPSSKAMWWTGCVISGLVIAMLAFSGIMKLVGAADTELTRLGWPNVAFTLGIVELACAIVYAIPRTAVLGAILLTGYLGGATATHVRIEESFIPPVIGGALVWLGLFLRDARIRTLIPLRS